MIDRRQRLHLTLFILMICLNGFSQNMDTKVKNILTQQWAKAALPLSDIDQIKITDAYTDDVTGLTYVYAQQYLGSIPIELALANFVFKNSDCLLVNTDRLVQHISSKTIIGTPQVSASDATTMALIRSGSKMYLRSKPQIVEEKSPRQYLFKKPEDVLENIPAELMYRVDQHDQLNLYWKVSIHQSNGDYWENYVNAASGNIDMRRNQTISCFPSHPSSNEKNSTPTLPYLDPTASSQYRVFPLPISAPNAGAASVISDPADVDASPLGWHDDGTTSYTITQGNNTHSFSDPDSNYISSNDEPKAVGGLTFDYTYNPSGTITQNKNAAIVNLFYMNNVMHDFAYNYGFTELAGNFQTKNITGKGKGNDAVISLGQYGSNGTGYRNNSDFLSPPDGAAGRMRMFVWNIAGSKLLKVIDPVSLATGFETGTADFGSAVSTIAVNGKAILVSDGSANATFGCKPLLNAADIRGKVAIIDRGDCFFHEKACNAQAAGAIAVIIVNYENTPLGMAALSPAPCSVNIPVISVSSKDGAFIKNNITAITLSIQKPASNGSPDKDGSFDNGIIAHEYGHGISTRLTGGPSNSSCLNNDEQMGEGWSDFMALVTTVTATDKETTPKGVGTFVFQQESTDRGIRKYVYSTDMNINPETYEDTYIAEEHALGAVWTAMLWELYWKLTNAYGWDPNLYRGNGGNNKAIRLVFEGMRLQPCSPGFVDGRDAILKADVLLYKGENQCLIWQAFAKRGLGFSAKQGSSNDKSDGVAAFDLPPSCIPTVKISKTMTPMINPGDDITVNINVRNDTKTDITNVIIKDSIPAGATFKAGSSSTALTQNGNVLSLKVNSIGAGEAIGLVYKLESSKSLYSKTVFIDSMENSEGVYDIFALQGSGIWEVTDLVSRSGKKSWFVPDQSTDNDQVLNLVKPVDISKVSKPVLRFYHRYKIQNASDGGIMRISNDGGKIYNDMGSNMFRNKYNGPVSYLALPIIGQRGFYGDTKSQFIPTLIDLASLKSKPSLLMQFRFGSDDSGSDLGWFIDDLEVFDMFNYNSQACVIWDGSSGVCAEAPDKGTVVESQTLTASKDETNIPLRLTLAPNPANEQLTIWTKFPKAGDVHGDVYSIDGKRQQAFNYFASNAEARYTLVTSSLPVGMYIITVKSGNYVGQEKFVIER